MSDPNTGRPRHNDCEIGYELGRRLESDWTPAALAHASILLTVALAPAFGIGVVVGPGVAVAVLLAYRTRSEFVSQQALQALKYQVAGGGVVAVFVGLGLSAIAAAWGVSDRCADALSLVSQSTSALPITLVVVGTALSVVLSWLAYGLYAALQVYQGRDSHYWLIGDWTSRRRGNAE